MPYKIYNQNCFDVIKEIQDKSIDFILTDPPYGQTPLEWDKEIDFDIFWKEVKRVIKPNGAICIFGQEPFSSKLRLSNLDWYKYDWYWKKERPTNIFQVKRRPAKYIENICVFYKEQCTYNEKKIKHIGPRIKNKPLGNSTTSISDNNLKVTPYEDDGTRHPCEILEFNRDIYYENYHPTQKPVALLKYLIEVYTDINETVLDMFMGSGSTGVACLQSKRNFIGFELNKDYFEICENRLHKQECIEKRRLF